MPFNEELRITFFGRSINISAKGFGLRAVFILACCIGLIAANVSRSKEIKSVILVKLQPVQSTPEGDREMSAYHKYKISSQCEDVTNESNSGEIDRTEFREIVLESIYFQRYTYIFLQRPISGHGYEKHYFVEPDETGRWMLVERFYGGSFPDFHDGVFESRYLPIGWEQTESWECGRQGTASMIAFQNIEDDYVVFK